MTNNINITVSAADETAILTALKTLSVTLTPYLHALTDDERQGILKMGDKSVAFVDKANNYGQQFTKSIPADVVDLAALDVDVKSVVLLNGFQIQLATLLRGVQDTMMLAGGEAMEASNLVYGMLKIAAKANVPGAQGAVNDLKQRYPGKPKQTPLPPAV